MSRPVAAPLLAALQAPVVRPAFFVEALFASGTVRLWSGYGPITVDGKTWEGAGALLALSAVVETQEVRAEGVTISLSGIPSALLSLALSEQYHGRIARVYLGAFAVSDDTDLSLLADAVVDDYRLRDPSALLIADLHLLFSGRMDVMQIAEDGDSATISVTVENRLVDLERPRVVLFTDEEQRRRFPGDGGLRYVASIVDAEIVWGR